MSEQKKPAAVENTIGEAGPRADITQLGHIGAPAEGGTVRNTIGRVSGNAKVVQAGDIVGDLHL
ncbi:hypothetical protein [Nocardiopsis tropica]|uniref:Uncharacterized protein n=1 Tax=Nocardiopsis tropica TaxID=109330 RepID=A0ABU7KV75_9ACTN|nr:hypothetical protein [Nocardiopsis umidischolae]MEE2053206.1 hypothetical protein [Nocardiopsis umidischolae]